MYFPIKDVLHIFFSISTKPLLTWLKLLATLEVVFLYFLAKKTKIYLSLVAAMVLQEWEKVEIRRHHGDTFLLIYKIPLLQNFETRFELTAVVEERCRTGNVN